MKKDGLIEFLNKFEKYLFSKECDGRLHTIRDEFEKLKVEHVDMKKEEEVQTELNKNISETIKTFSDKIVIDTKEYKNLIYFRESYNLLRSDFDKNLQSEICKIRSEYRNTVDKLNARIQELVTENIELRKQVAKNKHKKHWLW